MIETRVANISIDENGFCYIQMHNENSDKMGVAEANEICLAIEKICNGKPHLLLTDARGTMGTIAPGARKTIRNHPAMLKLRLAEAFIIDSLSNKLMANFYIRFDRPPNPTKVFTDKDEAVKWLLQTKNCANNS